MVEEEGTFREKIRNSFFNVKNDISNLSNSLKNIEEEAKEEKNSILALNSQFELLKEDLVEIKSILTDLKSPSIGNKGVINNHQQSSTVNSQQSSTVNSQQSSTHQNLEALEEDFSKLFKNLTDREFSVFMAIYELEKQFNETNYSQIANRLNLTETTVRGTVNRLISKNLPVSKERLFNSKTSLSLKKDFHNLNLLSKLVRLRQNPTDQSTLF
jgi:DNA-binding MarR family transcriptional regulator